MERDDKLLGRNDPYFATMRVHRDDLGEHPSSVSPPESDQRLTGFSEQQIRAMASVCLDLHEALEVRFGEDPYSRINQLREWYAVAEKQKAYPTALASLRKLHALLNEDPNTALPPSRRSPND